MTTNFDVTVVNRGKAASPQSCFLVFFCIILIVCTTLFERFVVVSFFVTQVVLVDFPEGILVC